MLDEPGVATTDLAPARAHLGLVVAAAAFGFAALFFGGLINIVHRWSTEPEWNHGFISAAVIAFHLRRHRFDWRALPFAPNVAGPVLVLVAAALATTGELSATFFVSQYGLVIVAAGLVLSLWGLAGLRLAAMPLVLLAVVVPIPFFVESSLSIRLQLLSSQAGVSLLQFLGVAAHNDGNVIDLGAFQLDVAQACSGLRYLFPLTGLAVIVAYLYRGPTWPKVLTVVLAPPIAVGMNIVRIAMVGVLVDREGIDAAEGFLHLFEGWAIFLICALLLVGELALANRFVRPRASLLDRFGLAPPAHSAAIPRGARRLPRAFLAASMILILFGAIVTVLRARPDSVPSHPALAVFPLRIGAWTGEPIRLPSDQAAVLGHPDYTMATYTTPDGSIANLFVAYYDRQQQGTAIHSPKACLPGGGWKVVSSRVVRVAVPGGSVPMNRVLIEGDGAKQLVYYGFFQRGRWMTNEYAVKAALLWDAVVRNRTDGALVRVVGPVQPSETEQAADRNVTKLLTDSYPAIVQFVPR